MTSYTLAATERYVDVGHMRLRVLEQGSGPAVVLCHGFPGLAHSWRNQLPVLAANGYRAIAPDMRCYGGSDRPSDASAYSRHNTVADLVGLLDAFAIESAVFVGHDFGAALVWDLPQWAPGRVRALIVCSVPRSPQPPVPPTEAFAEIAARHFLHMHHFQQPGVADAELAGDPAGFLSRVYWALSGHGRYADVWTHPSEGNGYLDVLPDAPGLPWPWMSEAAFRVYVDTFTRTGFTGGLNWYRVADIVWREKQIRPDEPVTVPTVFIAGDRDPGLETMPDGSDPIEMMRLGVPGLTGVHVLPEVGHFVQMEATAQTNQIMLGFLRAVHNG